MVRRFLAIALLGIGATFTHAQPSVPSSFQSKTIHSPEAADMFVRWGGKGPVVVLIHGYAENSDSWAPLAADLMKDHTLQLVQGGKNRLAGAGGKVPCRLSEQRCCRLSHNS
jgi:hypothetical protein